MIVTCEHGADGCDHLMRHSRAGLQASLTCVQIKPPRKVHSGPSSCQFVPNIAGNAAIGLQICRLQAADIVHCAVVAEASYGPRLCKHRAMYPRKEAAASCLAFGGICSVHAERDCSLEYTPEFGLNSSHNMRSDPDQRPGHAAMYAAPFLQAFHARAAGT